MGRKCEIGDFLRDLDDISLAFRVAGRGSRGVDGWLRAVRKAIRVPVRGLAEAMGVKEGEVYRLEDSERAGTIGLGKLRAAAEGLGCELVYGLAPKEGTLAGMAAVLEAGRAQKRAEARALRLEKAREKRYDVAARAWEKQRRTREKAQREGYWRAMQLAGVKGLRIRPPKELPPEERPGVEMMRKMARRVLRRNGVRIR